jgi:hypothetical protein
MKKIVLMVLCLAPFSAISQHRRAPTRREEADGFVNVIPIGPGIMPNQRLNDWAATFGRPASTSLMVIDLFDLYGRFNNDWYGGIGFGMFISEPALQGAYYFNFSGGRCIFARSWFQSNLNLNVLAGQSVISNIVPRSVQTPNSKYVIHTSYVGAGISSSNYLSLYTWGSKWKREYTIAVGVEYGITFIGQSDWLYGPYSGRHSNNSKNVVVPDVPSMDPYFTYVKFSLAMRF